MLPVDRTAGGWIPARVTNFGRRFADARGFSGRLDAELEAAAVSLRSGEFVVVTVAAAFGGMILGFVILGSPWLALGVGAVCGSRSDGHAEGHPGSPRGEAPRTAPGRAHDHGELAPSRSQLPPGARHDGEGDRAARRHRVPARRRRDPPGAERRGCVGSARRAGRKRGLQVGRPRREHPARGRREPGRDPGQRRGHAARARHHAAAGPCADVRGSALRLGPRPDAVRDRALHVRGQPRIHHVAVHDQDRAHDARRSRPAPRRPGSCGCGRSWTSMSEIWLVLADRLHLLHGVARRVRAGCVQHGTQAGRDAVGEPGQRFAQRRVGQPSRARALAELRAAGPGAVRRRRGAGGEAHHAPRRPRPRGEEAHARRQPRGMGRGTGHLVQGDPGAARRSWAPS